MATVKLSNGAEMIVSDDDLPFVQSRRWHLSGNGYVMAYIGGHRSEYLHRLLMPTPVGLYVDHINRNKLDNRRENLRIATPQESAHNMGKRSNPLTSRFKGVSLARRANGNDKWAACITKNGHKFHLGYWTTEIEAAKAYDEVARAEHGRFVSPNFNSNEETAPTGIVGN